MAIDTATEICAVALGAEAQVLEESQIAAGRSHLELLLPEIHAQLARRGLDAKDIEAVSAGTGPGTFSGLRVGIATARGLAQALRVPVFGHSTLRALAMGMAAGEADESTSVAGRPLLMPVIDARRGQVFAQLFEAGKDRVAEISEIMCLTPDELLEAAPKMSGKEIVAAGNGILAYYPLFEKGAREGPLSVIARDDPRHSVRASCHLEAIRKKGFDEKDILEVVPVYVREPDADKTVLLRKRAPWLR